MSHRRDPEIEDMISKIRYAMEANADPLRASISKAICGSTDPRVTAIRRKCSLDQIRALTECVAKAIEEQRDLNQTGLGCEQAPAMQPPRAATGR